jgi:hypothetical protein
VQAPSSRPSSFTSIHRFSALFIPFHRFLCHTDIPVYRIKSFISRFQVDFASEGAIRAQIPWSQPNFTQRVPRDPLRRYFSRVKFPKKLGTISQSTPSCHHTPTHLSRITFQPCHQSATLNHRHLINNRQNWFIARYSI